MIWRALFLAQGTQQSEFDKLAIAALIAVVGTGLTGLASVYSATRQATAAYQVAVYNGIVSTQLTDMKARSDEALTRMKSDVDTSLAQQKAESEVSLAQLKVELDVGRIAYRELFGTATMYFHALRSAALVRWDDNSLDAAETAMVQAAQHTINVGGDMRDQWFAFWQRAQEIRRSALSEEDMARRPELVRRLIGENHDGSDFREIHEQLEVKARSKLGST